MGIIYLALHITLHLISIYVTMYLSFVSVTLWGRGNYHPHFTGEDNEV